MGREVEAVRKFTFDAEAGILKEDPLTGNLNDNTPNEHALYRASQLVCKECPDEEDCNPQKIQPPNYLFGLVKNTDLWIKGEKVQEPVCTLASGGVPYDKYRVAIESRS